MTTTYLVYHGAEHTRFGHSIGVMHLVSKAFDAVTNKNKMDYLLRDFLYCGVSYGKYDLERLIGTLTVYTNKDKVMQLAIEKGGIQAFEEFVLARYFMFIQVYFHKTRRYFYKIWQNI